MIQFPAVVQVVVFAFPDHTISPSETLAISGEDTLTDTVLVVDAVHPTPVVAVAVTV